MPTQSPDFFNKVTKVLGETKITDTFSASGLIPKQNYYFDTMSFCQDLLSLVQSQLVLATSGSGSLPVLFFSDGVPKKSTDFVSHLDDVLLTFFASQHLQARCVNLADHFGVTGEDLHAHEHYVSSVAQLLVETKPLVVVALGSGTLTDLVKHAVTSLKSASPADAHGLLFLSVPTALTVTAYTSAFAVLDLGGAKKTFPSRAPDLTWWLEPLLSCAPLRLTRAGYGDLLARFVAYGDWYLGSEWGLFERYDETAFTLMSPFVAPILNENLGLDTLEIPKETIQILSAAISMAGIAMTVSRETTPLSGFEHVISHGLDFYSMTFGRTMPLHGEQVALGSLISAQLYEWVLQQKRFAPPAKAVTKINFRDFLKNMLAQIPLPQGLSAPRQIGAETEAHFFNEFQKKHEKWLSNIDFLSSKGFFSRGNDEWEQRVKPHLSSLIVGAQKMERLVKAGLLPCSGEELNPAFSSQTIRWAVRFSPFIRSRFSVADLVFWLGVDPASAAGI